MARKAKTTTIETRLDEKEALKQQLADARSEFQFALAEVTTTRNAFREAARQLSTHEERDEDQQFASDLDDLREQFNQTKETWHDAERHCDEIRPLVETLSDTLQSWTYKASVDDVFTHRKNVEDARQAVARIEAAIQEQHDRLATAPAVPTVSAALVHQRDDLAAEVALGIAKQAEVDKLDAEIKQIESAAQPAAAKRAELDNQVANVLTGLERKLDAARAKLTGLDAKTDGVLFEFLMTHAEQLGDRYITLCEELVDVFDRLSAMEHILRPYASDVRAGHTIVLSFNWDDLLLPMPNLKVCERTPPNEDKFYGRDTQRRIIYSANDARLSGHFDQSVEDERARLANDGIELAESC